MRSGGCPAGSGRALRLDPFALPVCYAAGDSAADGRVREIELHRERVVVRRSLAGMRMAINLPLAAFAGVGLRLAAGEVAVVLAHKDPGLALPLFLSDEADDVTAAWRSWGAVLGLPLLVEDEDGWREPFARLGGVRIDRPRPRRRRRSVLQRRRPTMPLRRARGGLTAAAPVHRGEREIIARN
jgi:Family of unknown function (DUF6101)